MRKFKAYVFKDYKGEIYAVVRAYTKKDAVDKLVNISEISWDVLSATLFVEKHELL